MKLAEVPNNCYLSLTPKTVPCNMKTITYLFVFLFVFTHSNKAISAGDAKHYAGIILAGTVTVAFLFYRPTEEWRFGLGAGNYSGFHRQ